MRTYSTYRVHWNRKHEKKPEALIQIEVLLPCGRQKWVGTGLKIPEREWDPATRQIINTPFATRLNKQVQELIEKIRAHELQLLDNGQLLTAEEVDIALSRQAAGSFVAYMLDRAGKKENSGKYTRSFHQRVAKELRDFGIERYSDLTYTNIVRYNEHLAPLAQTTRAKRHTVVHQYIKEAIREKKFPLASDPYYSFEYSRGKSKIRNRLDDDEIRKLIAHPPDETRDIAVFMLHTGIHHRDLVGLTANNVRNMDGGMWIEGLRNKTGELYTVFLLPPAAEIVQRHRGGATLLPVPATLQKLNLNLKILAAAAGIRRNLSTYSLRHTYATWMLRLGVPISTIQASMGHSNISTTMIYAKLEKATMQKDMMAGYARAATD